MKIKHVVFTSGTRQTFADVLKGIKQCRGLTGNIISAGALYCLRMPTRPLAAEHSASRYACLRQSIEGCSTVPDGGTVGQPCSIEVEHAKADPPRQPHAAQLAQDRNKAIRQQWTCASEAKGAWKSAEGAWQRVEEILGISPLRQHPRFSPPLRPPVPGRRLLFPDPRQPFRVSACGHVGPSLGTGRRRRGRRRGHGRGSRAAPASGAPREIASVPTRRRVEQGCLRQSSSPGCAIGGLLHRCPQRAATSGAPHPR